jgi:myo-inositol-1(or 4)-monophosphatase
MNEILDLIKSAAKEAGKVTQGYLDQTLDVSFKTSHQDIVTQADLESQQRIHEEISKGMQTLGYSKEEVGFIGEEGLNVSGEHRFIVDPLDGTTNFSVRLDYYAISIAYLHQGEILIGVIYNPKDDVFYIAEKGKGVRKEAKGKVIELQANVYELKDTVLSGHFVKESQTLEKLLKVYGTLYPNIRGLRNPGALVLDLAYFSDNIFPLIINGGCFVWDLAAAYLIVKESGGVMVDWEGKEIEFDLEDPKKSYKIIVCHPNLLPEVLPLFQAE